MGVRIQNKETGPGAQYRVLTRLAEEPEAPWDEMEVQRLWFEQAYRTPLKTTDGEEVEVLQPGFWNKAGGPDFSHASLRTASGRVECGAVEVHLSPVEWSRHRHDRDPHYDPVILHVVWQAGPKTFFPTTQAGGVVRQVELAPQLRLPLQAARRAFQSTREEREVGARLGMCHAELGRLPEERRMAILEEAGWYRFHRRVEQMRARVALVGWEQVLWQGLADALGYANNRDAFGWVARRLPVSRMLKIKDPLEREAWLYGVSGLLPSRWEKTPTREWPRQIWDGWWPHRGADGAPELPPKRWVRRGLRPMNRPERRMAVLAWVGDKGRWNELVRLVRAGDGRDISGMLGGGEHGYWSHRLAWGGKRAAKPIALMGPGRLASFLFNTAWPLAWDGQMERVGEGLKKARSLSENRAERLASVRLLGSRRRGRGGRSLLVQEGLIQIYQDFCLRDHRQCLTCDFPELVRSWNKEG
jgi:hypothetical protein